MLRLSRLSEYAFMMLTVLGKSPGKLCSASDLAAQVFLEPPTASKVLKLLARSGLVDSVRGAHGGYRLSRSPDEISVADVIAAIDGPLAMTECSIEGGSCAQEDHCTLRPNWQIITGAIVDTLENVCLTDLLGDLSSSDSIPLRVKTA